MSESLNLALNRQTAKIEWSELERFFAQGLVIEVEKNLDLIIVAKRLAGDEKIIIEKWLKNQQIQKVSDQHAKQFSLNNTVLWAVVIDPWVLIQLVDK